MTEQLKSEAQDMTMDTFIQRYPAMAETLKMEGAKEERERIQSVEDQLMSGHELLIQSLKFDGKTTGAEAAIKVLAAEKESRTKMLANLKADAPSAVPMPSIHQADKNDSAPDDEELPAEEKYEAQWRKDAKLRAEFGSKEAFMAYMKAQSNGQVRLLRRAAE